MSLFISLLKIILVCLNLVVSSHIYLSIFLPPNLVSPFRVVLTFVSLSIITAYNAPLNLRTLWRYINSRYILLTYIVANSYLIWLGAIAIFGNLLLFFDSWNYYQFNFITFCIVLASFSLAFNLLLVVCFLPYDKFYHVKQYSVKSSCFQWDDRIRQYKLLFNW